VLYDLRMRTLAGNASVQTGPETTDDGRDARAMDAGTGGWDDPATGNWSAIPWQGSDSEARRLIREMVLRALI